MNTNDIEILVGKIQSAKNILIAGHKNPDGDSLCSVLALGRLVKLNFGKDAVCVYDGNIPDMLDGVPTRDDIRYIGHVDLTMPFDLAIILDYGSVNNIGGVMPALESAGFVIEIDHHKNDAPVANLCINEINAAAVGEIIFNISNKLNWVRDNETNELIATSIITDTGNFKYVRNGNVFRIIAELVDAGVNIESIFNSLNNKPRRTVLTEAGVVSRTEFLYRGRVALATIDAQDYKKIDGRGNLILMLLGQIKGVEYVIVLKRQKENQTGVSLRSKSRPIDSVAMALGGGGHPYAAGAVVREKLDVVRAKVIELIKEILK